MKRAAKRSALPYLLFLFAVGSISGWCMEVLYRSIASGCLTIPGFLFGPYCPIYGFGLVLCKSIVTKEPWPFSFGKIVVLTTLLEYLCSELFEMIFHVLLWDYSMLPLSIGTSINLSFSLVWGLVGMVASKGIEPHLHRLFIAHRKPIQFFSYVVLAAIVLDTGICVALRPK